MMMPAIFPVTCHTDHVGPGSTYVAIKGFSTDGLSFINTAIARGATRIVVSHDAVIPDDSMALIKDRAIYIDRVDDTRRALTILSAEAAGYPAQQLNIIAVTGTKGKTTTTFFL